MFKTGMGFGFETYQVVNADANFSDRTASAASDHTLNRFRTPSSRTITCGAIDGKVALGLPRMLFGIGFGGVARVVRWQGEWSRHDWREPHGHLGPAAVDTDLHGQGIGRAGRALPPGA
jgi:hypothetical protein